MRASPYASLKAIQRDVPAERLARMRVLLWYFAPDLLWTHPRSRVAGNVLLQAWLARSDLTRGAARSAPVLSPCDAVEVGGRLRSVARVVLFEKQSRVERSFELSQSWSAAVCVTA